MKKIRYIFITVTAFFISGLLNAQNQPPQTASAVNIGKSLGLFIFPTKNQDAATQDADELACYKWAMEQTGVDPINPPQIQAEQVDRSADGSAIVGSARGAAAGAAIGAIAGDTGKGAAIGAVAGAMRGRRAKAYGDAKQQQQNTQAAAATEKELMDNFKKAYSACMEGKGYTVK
ncbi:glycine zipper domain-containing protein [Flammeovirgaceae bacterium SG7u.111]|nr:glycine zipper domain-containing protein [Flammeovirgaceae bacterium SG7u.132]WPO34364.1 glycine zipper domain-containing protein [Flammeovirgaceae bacterium SG7u.111]